MTINVTETANKSLIEWFAGGRLFEAMESILRGKHLSETCKVFDHAQAITTGVSGDSKASIEEVFDKNRDYWENQCSVKSQEVLDGTYKPEIYKHSLIPKPNKQNEYREILIAEFLDRVVMSVINLVLEDCFDAHLHNNQIAYRKASRGEIPSLMGISRGDRTIVGHQLITASHNGFQYGVELDYKNAFPSVDIDCLLTRLKEDGIPDTLCAVIRNCLLTEQYNTREKTYREPSGIPQGLPFSGFLFNYALRPLWTNPTKGTRLWSYSDNLFIAARSQRILNKEVKRICQVSKGLGLSLIKDEGRWYPQTKSIKQLLGMKIDLIKKQMIDTKSKQKLNLPKRKTETEPKKEKKEYSWTSIKVLRDIPIYILGDEKHSEDISVCSQKDENLDVRTEAEETIQILNGDSRSSDGLKEEVDGFMVSPLDGKRVMVNDGVLSMGSGSSLTDSSTNGSSVSNGFRIHSMGFIVSTNNEGSMIIEKGILIPQFNYDSSFYSSISSLLMDKSINQTEVEGSEKQNYQLPSDKPSTSLVDQSKEKAEDNSSVELNLQTYTKMSKRLQLMGINRIVIIIPKESYRETLTTNMFGNHDDSYWHQNRCTVLKRPIQKEQGNEGGNQKDQTQDFLVFHLDIGKRRRIHNSFEDGYHAIPCFEKENPYRKSSRVRCRLKILHQKDGILSRYPDTVSDWFYFAQPAQVQAAKRFLDSFDKEFVVDSEACTIITTDGLITSPQEQIERFHSAVLFNQMNSFARVLHAVNTKRREDNLSEVQIRVVTDRPLLIGFRNLVDSLPEIGHSFLTYKPTYSDYNLEETFALMDQGH